MPPAAVPHQYSEDLLSAVEYIDPTIPISKAHQHPSFVLLFRLYQESRVPSVLLIDGLEANCSLSSFSLYTILFLFHSTIQ